MMHIRPLAVGLTPMETRRDLVLHVAMRAEEAGTAFREPSPAPPPPPPREPPTT